jgi:hypothetical protein
MLVRPPYRSLVQNEGSMYTGMSRGMTSTCFCTADKIINEEVEVIKQVPVALEKIVPQNKVSITQLCLHNHG